MLWRIEGLDELPRLFVQLGVRAAGEFMAQRTHPRITGDVGVRPVARGRLKAHAFRPLALPVEVICWTGGQWGAFFTGGVCRHERNIHVQAHGHGDAVDVRGLEAPLSHGRQCGRIQVTREGAFHPSARNATFRIDRDFQRDRTLFWPRRHRIDVMTFRGHGHLRAAEDGCAPHAFPACFDNRRVGGHDETRLVLLVLVCSKVSSRVSSVRLFPLGGLREAVDDPTDDRTRYRASLGIDSTFQEFVHGNLFRCRCRGRITCRSACEARSLRLFLG